MRKKILIPFVVCIVILLQGCVSLANQNKTAFGSEECSFPLYTYGGTIISSWLIVESLIELTKKPSAVIGLTMVVVDYPFTVAMDTITLPVSVVRDINSCTKKYNREKSLQSELYELETSQQITILFVRSNHPNKQALFNDYVDIEGV